MSAPIVVREVRPDDLPHLARLERESFARPWPAASLADELAQPHAHLLLAAVPPEPAPAAYACWRLVGDEAELLRIAVDPVLRRRGLARALFTRGWQRLTRRGARVCHLEVEADNTAAIALYRSLGFCRSGLRRRYYGDRDALLMRLGGFGQKLVPGPTDVVC